MIQKVFLGANCASGFVSLYEGFPPEEAFLHIIKGGPGCGKSSFMRTIGRAAEEQGMAVQYVLCSGDPDSLDGIYIPSLRRAWVDGTAPHVLEPRCFGANGAYEDLGRFCRLPMSERDAEQAGELTKRYRARYSEAYEKLAEAKALHDELEAVYRPYMDFAALTEYTARQVKALFPE